MKRVEVEIDGVVAQAELNEAGAPRATAALWDALPIEAQLEHTKWLGWACGFRPALAAAGELEHLVCWIYPGILLARPGRGGVLISYGALPNTDRSSGSSTAPGWSATATPCSRFKRVCTTKATRIVICRAAAAQDDGRRRQQQ